MARVSAQAEVGPATGQSTSTLVAWGIVLIAANLRAPLTAVGPVVGDIRDSTGMSAGVAGLLTTLPLLAFAGVSPLASPAARRTGIERALFGALVLLLLGLVVRSVGPTLTILLGTAVLGAGIAGGNVLIPGLIKQDFPHRVGRMTSLYVTVMATFAGVGVAVSVPLASTGLGWRGALAIWAVLVVVAMAVWWPTAQRSRHVPPPAGERAYARVWRSPLAWQVALYMGLQSFIFYAIVAWLPTLLIDEGLSPATAGWLAAIGQFASVFATFVVPVMAGRRRNQRGLVVTGVAACAAGTLGLLVVPVPVILALMWSVLLGVGTACLFSLALTMFGLRTRDARTAGALSGMAQSVGYTVAATAPSGLGLLHDATGSWTVPLLTMLAFTGGALCFGLAAARDRQVV